MQGVTYWVADGNVAEALVHFKRSAELYDAERDREYAFRFGQDIGVAAKAYLAIGFWLSGEPDRARAEIEQMMALAVQTEHAPTLVYAHHHRALFEAIRLDPRRAKLDAEAILALAQEHGMSLWQSMGSVLRSWAAASLGGAETELDEMRRALASCREQGVRTASVPFLAHLALVQAEAGRIDDAHETIAAAIADLDGVHFWDTEFYRIRGEIPLKRDLANTAPAEEAFRTAIAIAQQQKARSFELRAALSLAKLYQSTNRAVDAHAVLAHALEGFAPTLEFPEIEQAQTLLAVLAP
jgi:predicted ATPase